MTERPSVCVCSRERERGREGERERERERENGMVDIDLIGLFVPLAQSSFDNKIKLPIIFLHNPGPFSQHFISFVT